MPEIVPAIIPKSFPDLEDKIGLLVGAASLVQIDVCDGKFVPNKSWPFADDQGEFEELVNEKRGLPHWEEIDYEVHLMTDTPNDEVADWVRVGASRVIIHIEAGSDTIEDIIDEWGNAVEIGLAIKMQTPVEELRGFIEKTKSFQLMGNEQIGVQGLELDPKIYARIKELRKIAPEHVIAVDIGVNEETAPKLIQAGANKLIIGSAIMDSEIPKEAIKKFQVL